MAWRLSLQALWRYDPRIPDHARTIMPARCFAIVLLLATGLLAADTACAETARPVATLRVAFDRDGITAGAVLKTARP